MEIFTKKCFFRTNFRVTIPRGCRYNFRVWLPWGCATSRLLYPEVAQLISGYSNPEVVQPPGNHTQKLFEKNVSWKNSMIVVFLLLGWTMFRYRNLEIVQLPGYDIHWFIVESLLTLGQWTACRISSLHKHRIHTSFGLQCGSIARGAWFFAYSSLIIKFKGIFNKLKSVALAIFVE